jgi:hypothetical protein
MVKKRPDPKDTIGRFSPQQIEALDLVVFHLEMLEYGMSQKFDPVLERHEITMRVQRFYNAFALIHLITMMFLVDKKELPMGGFCYRALNDLGLSDKLAPVRKSLEGKVGGTAFGDFIRHSRNKLATHGGLNFVSLPPEAQAVHDSPRALSQFDRLMERLDGQVTRLRITLENRLKRERAYQDRRTEGNI